MIPKATVMMMSIDMRKAHGAGTILMISCSFASFFSV